MNMVFLYTLLSLTTTNGSVAPAYQRTTVCNINAAETNSRWSSRRNTGHR